MLLTMLRGWVAAMILVGLVVLAWGIDPIGFMIGF